MKNESKKCHKSQKKMAIVIILSVFGVFILAVMPVLTILIYRDNFAVRFKTADWIAYSVSEFEGLKCSECTFPSNKGQLLAGYRYSKENTEKKALL